MIFPNACDPARDAYNWAIVLKQSSTLVGWIGIGTSSYSDDRNHRETEGLHIQQPFLELHYDLVGRGNPNSRATGAVNSSQIAVCSPKVSPM